MSESQFADDLLTFQCKILVQKSLRIRDPRTAWSGNFFPGPRANISDFNDLRNAPHHPVQGPTSSGAWIPVTNNVM